MSADLTVPVVAWLPAADEELVRKRDHEAAIASLSARLEAAERDAAYYAWHRMISDALPPACFEVWLADGEGRVRSAYTGTHPRDILDEGGVTHWAHRRGKPLPPDDAASQEAKG